MRTTVINLTQICIYYRIQSNHIVRLISWSYLFSWKSFVENRLELDDWVAKTMCLFDVSSIAEETGECWEGYCRDSWKFIQWRFKHFISLRCKRSFFLALVANFICLNFDPNLWRMETLRINDRLESWPLDKVLRQMFITSRISVYKRTRRKRNRYRNRIIDSPIEYHDENSFVNFKWMFSGTHSKQCLHEAHRQC